MQDLRFRWRHRHIGVERERYASPARDLLGCRKTKMDEHSSAVFTRVSRHRLIKLAQQNVHTSVTVIIDRYNQDSLEIGHGHKGCRPCGSPSFDKSQYR